jgi:LacI family transcriptional regulator
MRDSGKGEEVVKLGLPVIVSVHLKEHIAGFPYIDTNGIRIGQMAADHLLERGFRHLGFCGFDHLHWSRSRCQNFVRRVAEAGFEAHVYKQPKSRRSRSWEKEQTLIAEWLSSVPKPVGVMACNDDRGRQVTEACKTVGLRVPEEVAVIGADNDDLVCELSDPPLSSVALNVERGGYEAAELLDRLMHGEKMAGQSIIVQPTHVVARQSTDILAVEDQEVAYAVRFIRDHARQPVQVSEVAEAVGLSRRALQQRFRTVLKRTVYDEIRRARMRLVAEMLAETNLAIYQISEVLGYSGLSKLSRAFQRETGMSPVAYRRQYGLK